VTDRADENARRASDARFLRRRSVVVESLGALLGPHARDVAPLADADQAAALAAEARASHRAAEPHAWALARRAWSRDERAAVVELLHAINARLGARASWLVLPGWEPQAVALSSDVVLDNPLGFAAAAGFEMMLLDREVPAGMWLLRHSHAGPDGGTAFSWDLEVWGEPWLSATTRALRETPQRDPEAG
jgi:hypothetical protein